jgi:hypothetical protein
MSEEATDDDVEDTRGAKQSAEIIADEVVGVRQLRATDCVR